MSQRYGGEFSPKGNRPEGERGLQPARPGPLDNRRPARYRARTKVLFFAPVPLIFMGLGKPPVEMAVDFAAGAILLLAAWLLVGGLEAEEAYNDRKVARRPAIPRKIFASVLTGIGVLLAAMEGLSGALGGVLYGAIAAGLHTFAFGIDPLRDKGMEGIDVFQTERVARALDTAEGHLADMRDAALRAKDRHVMNRVEQFQATAREMFRTVEEDPRDLSAARKFLGIYLLAARDATVKFADLYGATRDEKARSDYFSLLDDLEESFDAKRAKLLLADRDDLDVEIEVLRDRLKRDGLLAGDDT